jgi:hypothetical protein
MSSVASETVIQKFEVLTEASKKEVVDSIDFRFQKKTSRRTRLDKKKLLEISTRTEENIEAIEEVEKEINKW